MASIKDKLFRAMGLETVGETVVDGRVYNVLQEPGDDSSKVLVPRDPGTMTTNAGSSEKTVENDDELFRQLQVMKTKKNKDAVALRTLSKGPNDEYRFQCFKCYRMSKHKAQFRFQGNENDRTGAFICRDANDPSFYEGWSNVGQPLVDGIYVSKSTMTESKARKTFAQTHGPGANADARFMHSVYDQNPTFFDGPPLFWDAFERAAAMIRKLIPMARAGEEVDELLAKVEGEGDTMLNISKQFSDDPPFWMVLPTCIVYELPELVRNKNWDHSSVRLFDPDLPRFQHRNAQNLIQHGETEDCYSQGGCGETPSLFYQLQCETCDIKQVTAEQALEILPLALRRIRTLKQGIEEKYHEGFVNATRADPDGGLRLVQLEAELKEVRSRADALQSQVDDLMGQQESTSAKRRRAASESTEESEEEAAEEVVEQAVEEEGVTTSKVSTPQSAKKRAAEAPARSGLPGDLFLDQIPAA